MHVEKYRGACPKIRKLKQRLDRICVIFSADGVSVKP